MWKLFRFLPLCSTYYDRSTLIKSCKYYLCKQDLIKRAWVSLFYYYCFCYTRSIRESYYWGRSNRRERTYNESNGTNKNNFILDCRDRKVNFLPCLNQKTIKQINKQQSLLKSRENVNFFNWHHSSNEIFIWRAYYGLN